MEIEIFFTTLDFGAFKTARMHFYFADESILLRRREGCTLLSTYHYDSQE